LKEKENILADLYDFTKDFKENYKKFYKNILSEKGFLVKI